MTFWGIGGTDYFTHWLSPNVIVMALAGYYLIVRQRFNFPPRLTSIIQRVAQNSFGIYLVHMLVINLLDKYLGLYLDRGHTNLWWYGSYKFILVFSFSYLLTRFWRRLWRS